MKKITVLFVLSLFVFSGCSAREILDNVRDLVMDEEETASVDEEDEVSIEELQQQIDQLQDQLDRDEEDANAEDEVEEVEEEVATEDTEVVIEESDPLSFITVTSPYDGESFFLTDPIAFYGSISSDATKIVVTAYYHELMFSEEQGFLVNQDMVDVYTLQNFDAGDTEFVYRASMEWDNLGHGDNEYIFTAYFEDGSTLSDSLTVTYEADGLGKPVVYLYPEETLEVFVNVEPNLGMLYSEPELGDGWNVLANPNGLLYDLSAKSFFPYLYWEGLSTSLPKYDEGFCVADYEIKSFFSEKLAVLGLNEKEIRDFFEYWEPRLTDSPYYLITFIDQEELEKLAPLTVEPKPDTVIRVFFDYEAIAEPIEIAPQDLEAGVREGFTVIEWGGSLF